MFLLPLIATYVRVLTSCKKVFFDVMSTSVHQRSILNSNEYFPKIFIYCEVNISFGSMFIILTSLKLGSKFGRHSKLTINIRNGIPKGMLLIFRRLCKYFKCFSVLKWFFTKNCTFNNGTNIIMLKLSRL